MRIVTSPENLPTVSESCVALGNFDGVHKGHLFLIGEMIKKAKESGLSSVVYTFADHPRITIDRNSNFRCITTPEEKMEILKGLGIDILYLEDFKSVKDLSPESFCEQVLIEKLNTKIAFCGENFHFGKNSTGNPDLLKNVLSANGRQAVAIPPILEGDVPVSSTRIRLLIAEGKMDEAKALLGRPFSIHFPVVHGAQLGREIGIPTINQNFPSCKLIPQKGVYACITHVNGIKYASVSNVGTKPTVTANIKNPPMLCETHIIGFQGDLYGQKIQVDFYQKLRDEKKFASLDELIAQVKANIEESKIALEKLL